MHGMKIIKIDNSDIREALREASLVLDAGGIVCFPTETFYGLGVKYNDRSAHERLFALKRRARDKALPLIAGGTDALKCIVGHISDIEALLIRRQILVISDYATVLGS